MIGKITKSVSAVALFISLLLIQPYTASAEVNVNVNIGIPPVFTMTEPPEVVVIPGTYAYVVPDISVDIIFYRGYWYRPHEDRWFISHSYNGPWVYIVREKMPGVILNLPPNYRNIPPGNARITYRQLEKNWKLWEEKKRWDDKNLGKEYKKREKSKHRTDITH